MSTDTAINDPEQFIKEWQQKYQASTALFSNNFEIIAKIDNPIPGLAVEVRRFFWAEAPKQTTINLDICYLSLAITPRPQDMKVDYLGTYQANAFTTYGNCCFVPANQNTFTQGSIGEYQEICCLFDPVLLKPHLDWQWTPLELASCFNIKNLNIQHNLLRLAEEASHPGYGSQLLVQSLFNSLLIELSRHFKSVRSAGEQHSGKLSSHQMHLITDKISRSLHTDLNINALAELCGISERHLSRMFKKTTGYTLGKYISQERINQAKFLLSQPEGQIKEVAFKCGFKSQSSFSQAFHDATGQTPSQFRHRP